LVVQLSDVYKITPPANKGVVWYATICARALN
jgi:hypothetical protein